MDDTMRNILGLVEKLGDGIGEAISKSPKICGVVDAINAEGFLVSIGIDTSVGLQYIEPPQPKRTVLDSIEYLDPDRNSSGPPE
jgi:hypothetical protein